MHRVQLNHFPNIKDMTQRHMLNHHVNKSNPEAQSEQCLSIRKQIFYGNRHKENKQTKSKHYYPQKPQKIAQKLDRQPDHNSDRLCYKVKHTNYKK